MGVHFINFTITKFAVSLSFGIITAYFFPSYILPCVILLALCMLTLSASYFLTRHQLYPNVIFGIVTFLCFYVLGYLNYSLRLPNAQKDHYSHTMVSTHQTLQVTIVELLKPSAFHSKYIVRVDALDSDKTSGNIVLLVSKDTPSSSFLIDDTAVISGEITAIHSSLNPFQFDYAHYMKQQGVYHQLQISDRQILFRNKGKPSIRGYAEKLRTHLIKKIAESSIGTEEQAILSALVLGQRRDMTKALYTDYINAGAIHILAVSGLHVGILFLLFSAIFKPLERLPKGQTIKGMFVITFLFGFALVAGWSPSVVRAATMFSLFAVAKMLNRPTNSFNTLFLSFFGLLIVNPMWLFHVGFQLSYMAVFAILFIQPKLSRHYRPRNYFLKKFWDIITVTLAAQLGVLPLSLYYFHQFPGLFMITNLIILPFLGVLLLGGILIFVFAAFNVLPNFLAQLYHFLIRTMNQFIHWVAHQDSFLIEDISFSKTKAVFSYLLIVSLFRFWNKTTYKRTLQFLVAIVLFIGICVAEKMTNSGSKLTVFHKSKHTLIGHKNGANLKLFRSDSSLSYKDTSPIKGYIVGAYVAVVDEQAIPKIFTYADKQILVVDSLATYPNVLQDEIIILTQSPKLNLNRLIDSLAPSIIVADGSNYTSYVRRWKETCEKRKLPFYHTGTQGAFVVKR